MSRTVLAGAALAATVLWGCGVDTATTAATGAAIKKQEMDAGTKTMEQVQQKLEQSTQLMQESAQRADPLKDGY